MLPFSDIHLRVCHMHGRHRRELYWPHLVLRSRLRFPPRNWSRWRLEEGWIFSRVWGLRQKCNNQFSKIYERKFSKKKKHTLKWMYSIILSVKFSSLMFIRKIKKKKMKVFTEHLVDGNSLKDLTYKKKNNNK